MCRAQARAAVSFDFVPERIVEWTDNDQPVGKSRLAKRGKDAGNHRFTPQIQQQFGCSHPPTATGGGKQGEGKRVVSGSEFQGRVWIPFHELLPKRLPNFWDATVPVFKKTWLTPRRWIAIAITV